MHDNAICNNQALQISLKMLERGYIHTPPENEYYFSIELAGSYLLSISVPFDANSGSAIPRVAETAIVRDGGLVNVRKLGYYNVRRLFCGTDSASDDSVIDKLCSEINRINILVSPSNQEDDDVRAGNEAQADDVVVAQVAEQVRSGNQEQDG